jgi:protoporphyrinogen/coproporphyrinogen III oxidase
MKRIVVVGGGIAGLATAYALRKQKPAADVVLLERSPATGGNIRTDRIAGYTCERGPDGFLDNAPETMALVRDLQLEPRLLRSRDAARRRFIVRHGRLCPAPASAAAVLTTAALSWPAKLRLMCEPFAPRRVEEDESIHEFAARHIGREAADILIGAMVSGIYAGDPRALSLAACFPKMRKMEDEYGSLVRAMVARRRRGSSGAAGPSGCLTSFVTGMSELVDALTAALGGTVRTSAAVHGIGTRRGGGYVLQTNAGTIHADAVVLAGSSTDSAAIVRGCDVALSELLAGIPTAPLAVVGLGYRADTLPDRGALNGFGFLVPRREPFRILGALWETSIYGGRAPAGQTLLRVMVGGACDRDAVALDNDRLVDIVRRDLAAIMRIDAAPDFVRIIRHRRGIPQFVKGHLAKLGAIEDRLRLCPGLYIAGSSYRGVSLNACIEEAPVTARRVIEDLRAQHRGAA